MKREKSTLFPETLQIKIGTILDFLQNQSFQDASDDQLQTLYQTLNGSIRTEDVLKFVLEPVPEPVRILTPSDKPSRRELEQADLFVRSGTPYHWNQEKRFLVSEWEKGSYTQCNPFHLWKDKEFRTKTGKRWTGTNGDSIVKDPRWIVGNAYGLYVSDCAYELGLKADIDDLSLQDQVQVYLDIWTGYGLEPLLIFTGNKGLHAFLLFERPFRLETEADRNRSKRVQTLFVAAIGADLACIEPRHEMRTPSWFRSGIKRIQPTLHLPNKRAFLDIDEAERFALDLFQKRFQVSSLEEVDFTLKQIQELHNKRKALKGSVTTLKKAIEKGKVREDRVKAASNWFDEAETLLKGAEGDHLNDVERILVLDRSMKEALTFGQKASPVRTGSSANRIQATIEAGSVPRWLKAPLEKACSLLAALGDGRKVACNQFVHVISQKIRDRNGTVLPEGMVEAFLEAMKQNGSVEKYGPETVRSWIVKAFEAAISQPKRKEAASGEAIARVPGFRYQEAKGFYKRLPNGKLRFTVSPDQDWQPITIIGTFCGSGKTEAVLENALEFEKAFPGSKKAIVVPRKALGREEDESLHDPKFKDLGFEFYLTPSDEPIREPEKKKGIVSVIDSFRRFWDLDPDWLFIDEAPEVLQTVLKKDSPSRQRTTSNLQDSHDLVRALIQDAIKPGSRKRIILSGAYWNEEHLQALKNIVGTYEPTILLEPSESKPLEGIQVHEIPEKAFWLHLLTVKRIRKRVYIFESTESGCNRIAQALQTISDRNRLHWNIVVHTAQSPLKGKTGSRTIAGPWSEADFVIVNGTVGSGVSNIDERFEVAFVFQGRDGYTLTKSDDLIKPFGVLQQIQAAFRCRCVKHIFLASPDSLPDGLDWLPDFSNLEAEELENLKVSRSALGFDVPTLSESDLFYAKQRATLIQANSLDKFTPFTKVKSILVRYGAALTESPKLAPFTDEQRKFLEKLNFRSPKGWPNFEKIHRGLRFGDFDQSENKELIESWNKVVFKDQDLVRKDRERIAAKGRMFEPKTEVPFLLAMVVQICNGFSEDAKRYSLECSRLPDQSVSSLTRAKLFPQAEAYLELAERVFPEIRTILSKGLNVSHSSLLQDPLFVADPLYCDLEKRLPEPDLFEFRKIQAKLQARIEGGSASNRQYSILKDAKTLNKWACNQLQTLFGDRFKVDSVHRIRVNGRLHSKVVLDVPGFLSDCIETEFEYKQILGHKTERFEQTEEVILQKVKPEEIEKAEESAVRLIEVSDCLGTFFSEPEPSPEPILAVPVQPSTLDLPTMEEEEQPMNPVLTYEPEEIRYLKEAVSGSIQDVSRSGKGTRKRELNRKVFNLAAKFKTRNQDVPDCPSDIESGFLWACSQNGFLQEEGEGKVRTIIERAWKDGFERTIAGPSPVQPSESPSSEPVQPSESPSSELVPVQPEPVPATIEPVPDPEPFQADFQIIPEEGPAMVAPSAREIVGWLKEEVGPVQIVSKNQNFMKGIPSLSACIELIETGTPPSFIKGFYSLPEHSQKYLWQLRTRYTLNHREKEEPKDVEPLPTIYTNKEGEPDPVRTGSVLAEWLNYHSKKLGWKYETDNALCASWNGLLRKIDSWLDIFRNQIRIERVLAELKDRIDLLEQAEFDRLHRNEKPEDWIRFDAAFRFGSLRLIPSDSSFWFQANVRKDNQVLQFLEGLDDIERNAELLLMFRTGKFSCSSFLTEEEQKIRSRCREGALAFLELLNEIRTGFDEWTGKPEDLPAILQVQTKPELEIVRAALKPKIKDGKAVYDPDRIQDELEPFWIQYLFDEWIWSFHIEIGTWIRDQYTDNRLQPFRERVKALNILVA